ncbi:Creatinase/aminopeptidase [Calocera cornea HHB12733]|uniref:Creatinase/aminopeptidase n=1 Tax=Calocera cornea HHB12733 TaxID=1353952 RepID=A0A165FDT2_9BASI|nr:Creatinase/aminopeptidase [Calocera cornea HHB12733]
MSTYATAKSTEKVHVVELQRSDSNNTRRSGSVEKESEGALSRRSTLRKPNPARPVLTPQLSATSIRSSGSAASSSTSLASKTSALPTRPAVVSRSSAAAELPTLSRSNSAASKMTYASKSSHLSASTMKTTSTMQTMSTAHSTLSNISTSSSQLRVDSTERLTALRALFAEAKIGYYIVPSEDEHQSEYVADSDKRRQFISGFSGSAGVAVVGLTSAVLFTDSRYYIQARRQLDSNWTLYKVGLPGVKRWDEYVTDLPAGSQVGVDPRLLSRAMAISLSSQLTKKTSKLVFPRRNLVDTIWTDRPLRSKSPVVIHPVGFAGRNPREKIAELRSFIATRPGCTAYLVSALDEIAWLFNLRGADVEYNPVFRSYGFVDMDRAILFVDSSKLSDGTKAHLKIHGITFEPYEGIWAFLRKENATSGKVLLSNKTAYAITATLFSTKLEVLIHSEIERAKAIKNEVEIAGFREAYLRDGVAMARWLAWLEEAIVKKGRKITEWEAGEKLTEYRQQNENFMGLAYENISAYGPNAALPHYAPQRNATSFIGIDAPYLIDSGGNYRDGTCDTTRTYHFGTPTDEQMEAYTRVLQGHIAIDTAIFPEGTTGAQLDTLARQALWKDGLNYGHGTGHGYGQYLNVHEGPQGFGIGEPFRPGHVLTNEPGFYQEGHFGVRIESALVVRRVETKGQFGGDIWLGFERFTQVPIQTKMVKEELLTKEERAWLKDHNTRCRVSLAPLLEDDKRAMKWLKKETHRNKAGIEWD